MERNDMLSDRYIPRFLGYCFRNRFRQTVDDFQYFSIRQIQPSEQPFHFARDIQKDLFSTVSYNGIINEPLQELLVRSGTTAFLAIHDGRIIDERYFNGGNENTQSRVMSATKSLLSTLVGIAIDRGEIKSTQQPVTDYIPELKKGGFENFTLQNLLNMESGVPFDQGQTPWSIQMKQYLTSDTRRDLLQLKIADQIGETFHYNDWYPNLLALIVEIATGKKVSDYFEAMLWKPIGSEYPAFLVEDSQRNHFPKMDSGLVATAIDLAKFGSLYLNGGLIAGKRVLSEQWILDSTSPRQGTYPAGYFRRYDKSPWGYWFKTGKASYQNMWWGYQVKEDINDYFAMGVLGQILYICPRNRAIFVRLGKEWGVQAWWPTILKTLADRLG